MTKFQIKSKYAKLLKLLCPEVFKEYVESGEIRYDYYSVVTL